MHPARVRRDDRRRVLRRLRPGARPGDHGARRLRVRFVVLGLKRGQRLGPQRGFRHRFKHGHWFKHGHRFKHGHWF